MRDTHLILKRIKLALVAFALTCLCTVTSAELDWVRVTTEFTPPKRDGHNMVYDVKNQVALAFGAYVGDRFQPLHAYDGENWWPIEPSGDWPPSRLHFGMAYDASRDVVVVFGGFQGGFDYLGDTWEWDGTQWEEKFPAHSPSDRIYHSMIYHEGTEMLLLFGGYTEELIRSNELWTWDGIDWIDITPLEGPEARSSSPLVYDSQRGLVVLFGGADTGYSSTNDTWEWNGIEWEEILTEHSPGNTRNHVFAYDSNRGVSILFSGNNDPNGLSNQTWEYDGMDWTEIFPDDKPSPRTISAASYDSNRQRVILYGGYTAIGSNDETWEYYDVPTPSPSPTPTITPSPTITPTPVPTCTPTATPIDGILLALHLPEEPIHAGDTFYLDVSIHNANPDPLTDIPLFVILEAAGTFWYHPSWSMEPAWETLSIIPTGTMGVTILEAFEWPGNAGTGTARFWGALTDQEMTRVLGNYDVRDFQWN